MFLKIFLRKCLILICIKWLRFKWRLLKPYYDGLLIQAKFLYRQHYLFDKRHQLLGLDFAEKAFEQDARHFLEKARKEPFSIRFQIFWDATLGREQRPYYL